MHPDFWMISALLAAGLLAAGLALTYARTGDLSELARNATRSLVTGVVTWGRSGPYSF